MCHIRKIFYLPCDYHVLTGTCDLYLTCSTTHASDICFGLRVHVSLLKLLIKSQKYVYHVIQTQTELEMGENFFRQ